MIGNTPMSVNSSVQDQNTKKIKAPRYNCFPISCFFLLVIFVGIFCFIRRTKKDFDIRYCIEIGTYDYVYRNFTKGSHKIHLWTRASETR
ncbi:hypothetical protein Ahy_A06g029533 isoform B [Arachis hypogaea]|uniref:Uncharacterized protein n=1 Tax=Arachis hypogaea TaxID=3818 RepID=A0A445CTL2_ARAHY|nr:hypothetical protein Ahy_A06g029533 isoform B [Arachis hypogaea]